MKNRMGKYLLTLLATKVALLTSISVKPPFHTSYNPNLQKSILSPPPHLSNLKINESLQAYRTPYNNKKIDFTITRVAHDPDIFLLRNFITIEECNTIINQYASQTSMKQAETISNDNVQTSRKNCVVSWLPPDEKYPIVQSLMMDTANILIQNEMKNDSDTSVEDLQVLRYGVDGEFVLHHDGEPRFLTVIYYLNGVAGTWFPLARISEDMQNDNLIIKNKINVNQMESQFHNIRNNFNPQNKEDAMKLTLGNNFIPGEDGLFLKSKGDTGASNTVIEINQGDAVAFYSYKTDRSGQINWRALHSGTPTSEVKWIANHWFRRGPTAF